MLKLYVFKKYQIYTAIWYSGVVEKWNIEYESGTRLFIKTRKYL